MTEEAQAPVGETATGAALTQPARFAFDSDQIATIKRTVCPAEMTDPEFQMFMEVVGRYKLDPFTKQVYAALLPGRNGSRGTVAIIVARDGYLAIADRHPDFQGLAGDVVRAKDEYRTKTVDGAVVVYHEVKGANEDARGQIIGAWAQAYRKGRKPTYFFAKMASYKTGNKTWQNYPDAMILKVAESMALRKQFSVTAPVGLNVIGEEESYSVIEGPVTVVDEHTTIDWGPEPGGAHLRALFSEANRLSPEAFRPRKIAFTLAGADETKRTQVAADLTAFIAKKGGTVPTAAEASVREAADGPPPLQPEPEVEEEEVPEAEVVEPEAEVEAEEVAS